MKAQIVSKETIKITPPPSSAPLIPYKLNLFDQLTPTTYVPIIFFYPIKNFSQTALKALKISLLKTLTLYYPFSGQVNENLYIDNFHKGVPFLEAKVNCSLSDFLKFHEPESLNSFLPCNPFSKETDMSVPLISVQVSIFTCGGIALGWCMSHKVLDAATGSSFFHTWTSIFRGDFRNFTQPDLEQGNLFFPSRTTFPPQHLALMEGLWFVKDNYITRRFVFNAKSIAALKAIAKGDADKEPSRIQTLSCFIWKCCMAATKAISHTLKPSILVEAINLRQKTNPPMKDSSTGNLFWWAVAVTSPADENSTQLNALVNMLSEAIDVYKTDYTHSIQGQSGFETICEYCEQLEAIFELERPDIFAFTSWSNMSFTRPNFGWGEPYWVGVMGKSGEEFRNMTVFVDSKDGKGIEAWITLDEKRMNILLNDSEFLAFASPNPRFSGL